jgi:hypothetical protein
MYYHLINHSSPRWLSQIADNGKQNGEHQEQRRQKNIQAHKVITVHYLTRP